MGTKYKKMRKALRKRDITYGLAYEEAQVVKRQAAIMHHINGTEPEPVEVVVARPRSGTSTSQKSTFNWYPTEQEDYSYRGGVKKKGGKTKYLRN